MTGGDPRRGVLVATGVAAAVGAVIAAVLLLLSLRQFGRMAGVYAVTTGLLALCAAGQVAGSGVGAIALFRRRPVGRRLVFFGSCAGLAWLVVTVVDTATVEVAIVAAYVVGLPAVAALVLVLVGQPRTVPPPQRQAVREAKTPERQVIREPKPPQLQPSPRQQAVWEAKPPELRPMVWCAVIGGVFGALGIVAACSPVPSSIQLPTVPGQSPRPEPTGILTAAPTSPLPTGLPTDLPTSLPTDLPTSLPPGFPTSLPPGFPSLPGFPQETR